MKDIKKVMVCVDLSDYSKMTIELALAVVRGLKTDILLFNVINSRDVDAVKIVSPFCPGSFTVQSYIEKAKTERTRKLLEMIEQYFSSHRFQMSILIQVGIPFETIIKAIGNEKIDLVVLGNKGKSNLVGTLHGSNGEKVFRHSPVPVVSVRDREKFSRHR